MLQGEVVGECLHSYDACSAVAVSDSKSDSLACLGRIDNFFAHQQSIG